MKGGGGESLGAFCTFIRLLAENKVASTMHRCVFFIYLVIFYCNSVSNAAIQSPKAFKKTVWCCLY